MFRYFVLGFIVSVYAFYQLGHWPSVTTLAWASLMLVGALAWGAIRNRASRQAWRMRWPVPTRISALFAQLGRGLNAIIIGLLFGYIWVFLHSFLTDRLPDSVFFKPVTVVGQVVGLPQVSALDSSGERQRVKFTLALQRLTVHGDVQGASERTFHFDQTWSFRPPKIQLSWYQQTAHSKRDRVLPPEVSSGDVWRFQIKLKPRHASLNPGAFDYETYLFQKGIEGYGYVLTRDSPPERLSQAGVFGMRQALAQHLKAVFSESPFSGIFQALIDGDKRDISAEDWTLLQATGTIHLMAISGLHVAIVAGLGFALFGWVWRLGIRFNAWRWWQATPKSVFAVWGGILAATLYMAMAGFAIPTQRAWLMVVSGLVFLLIRRKFQPWSALALAAFLVVLWHPPSVLSQGFWLSFMAVAIIFVMLSWPRVAGASGVQKLLWLQLGLTLGLAPALVGYYHQLALSSFLANLVAVPFVSVIGLPLLFVTVLVSWVSDALTAWLMALNDTLWQGLWWGLQALSERLGFWVIGQLEAWQLVALYALPVTLWWLWRSGIQPRDRIALFTRPSEKGGADRRSAGLHRVVLSATFVAIFSAVWLAVILWPSDNKARLLPGEFRVTVLDVGQAQALVFETDRATVVYDTGAKWSDKMDGAKMALLPYLKSRGRDWVDVLIVSHSDSDHAGGAVSLLKGVGVGTAVSGQAAVLNDRWLAADGDTSVFQACEYDQAWSFSGVRFEILSPAQGLPQATNDNDASCVLRVTNGVGSVLVPGDVTERMEKPMVARYGAQLQADLLVAGHHGSRSSTSQAWLKAVKPEEVVFSSGFANRFHFPSQTVRQRLADHGIPWQNTACQGAIQYKITLNTQSPLQPLSRARSERPRWYAHSCEAFAETRDKAGSRWLP